MTHQVSLNLEAGAASAAAPLIAKLPAHVAEWLHESHEQLARALADAQGDAVWEPCVGATIAIEMLPLRTREFLWRGIQGHLPALADLLRAPLISEARVLFGAQLRLSVDDLLTVIKCCAPAPREIHGDSSSQHKQS